MKLFTKPVSTVSLAALIIVGYTVALSTFSFQLYKTVTCVIMLFVTGYYFVKIFKRSLKWYTLYMFNEPTVSIDKKVEKPRLFFYSISMPVMIIVLVYSFNVVQSGYTWIDITAFAVLNCLFFVSFLLINLTWSTTFENRYLPMIKNVIIRDNVGFKSSLTATELNHIFDRLVEHTFLEYLDEREKQEKRDEFSRIFINGILPDVPKFKLEMDNIQTYYVYKRFEKHTDRFTLEKFLNVFSNKNNKVSGSSILSSVSKANSGPKRQEDLDAIFIEIG